MAYPDEKNLTTVEKVVRWCELVGVTPEIEEDILACINRVSSFISLKISKRGVWLDRSITERYDGNSSQIMALSNCPINSVSSLKIDGFTIPPSTSFSVPGYVIQPDEFITLVGYYFGSTRSGVEITYNAGILPSDLHIGVLEQAILEVINFKLQRKKHADQTASRVGEGFSNQHFSEKDFPAEFWSAVKLITAKVVPLYVG